MTSQKKNITVTYDIYTAYDDIPNSTPLGRISDTELNTMMQTMRDVIASDVPRCVRYMSVEHSHAMYIYPTPDDTSEYNNLAISGIIYNDRSMCTHAAQPIDGRNRPEKNCLKNIRRGNCKCPLMRTVAELVLPNLYSKTK